MRTFIAERGATCAGYLRRLPAPATCADHLHELPLRNAAQDCRRLPPASAAAAGFLRRPPAPTALAAGRHGLQTPPARIDYHLSVADAVCRRRKVIKTFFEVMMLFTQCLGCDKSFPFEPGKKFHSNLCRSNFYEGQRLKKFRELWEQTPEFDYPESMRSLSPDAKFRLVVEGLANTGIHYYRLGIPKNVAGTTFEVRWFPMGGGGRHFLLVNPFEAPKDVPLPGLYLVALFDHERKVVGKPGWKLPVAAFNVACRWSSGTKVP